MKKIKDKKEIKEKSPAAKTKSASAKKLRVVLLDAYAIIHRAYHALPDFASTKGEPTGALYGLCTMLIKIITDLKPDYVIACYDLPGKTYRHEAYDQYKAGRAKTDPALVSQLDRSRDVFKVFQIPIYEKPGFEADDMLGTITELMKDRADIDIVIASGDMDTLQLVSGTKVKVYTLKKGISDTIVYDEAAVKARFGFGPLLLPDYKGLRGDPSDNIIGVKGIGDKTASMMIQSFGTIEEMYKKLKTGSGKNGEGGKVSEAGKKAFLDAGIKERIIDLLVTNEEEARFSKMLATIRRDAPIDFKLPEKKWRESLEIGPIVELFSELEFRTLGARVRDAFSLQPSLMPMEDTSGGPDTRSDEERAAAGVPILQEVLPQVDEKELRQASIALWVIDSNIQNPGLEEILGFAKTRDFAKAKEIIFAELDKRKLAPVFRDIELPLIPIVDRMEKRGIKIDKAVLSKLSKKYHGVLDGLQKDIWKMSGEEFNINSPKQLGVVLFEKMMLTAKNLKKTDGGARSTRESELAKMADSHPIIKSILEYRELQKLLSTYIDNIPNMLDKNDRLHSTFLQTGAATGRMSSNNPNLQNIPNKTELGRAIRDAFIADDGFTLLSFDYSQIELRIAAFLSKDEKLIAIFKNGEDVHTSVAARVFHVAPEKVDKEMRRRAKVINFGILYGMGVNALKANLGAGTTRAEAQEFYNNYFKEFSTLAQYLDHVKAETARLGYTETFYGRKRYFEGIKSHIHFIKASAERMAINAPIQGTEADIVKLAMVKIEAFLEDKKLTGSVFPLLQVHDELVYEVNTGDLPKVVGEMKKIMENIIPLKEIENVPIEVHAYKGKSWGEMEDIK